MSKEQLYIFDTTLREGVDFSIDDKVINRNLHLTPIILH